MHIPAYQAALLQAKAHRKLRQEVAAMLSPFNLNLLEWALLGMVSADKEVRITSAASELGVEIPMITSLLNSLEEKKMIERSVDQKDKRKRTLTLTQLGIETLACSQSHLKTELQHYFDEVSSKDLEGYFNVLNAIIKT